MIFDRLSADIFEDSYFQELFLKLSKYNAYEILGENITDVISEKELKHLLRFSDILSNASDPKFRNMSYKIVSLLNQSFCENPIYKTYSTAILSKIGNFPAMNYLDYKVELPFERRLDVGVKKKRQRVEGMNDTYFTDAQFNLFSEMKESNFYSFSGPTSMGKSFIIKCFIKDTISKEKKGNIVIVVPTRALIDQFSLELKKELKIILEEKNYSIVTSSNVTDVFEDENEDQKRDKRYICVLTPERLLSYLSEEGNPRIDYLFIDEAHKLTSENDYRSITLYLSIEKSLKRYRGMNVFFASPNVSNPGVFLELFGFNPQHSFHTNEAPVSQNLFFVDLVEKNVKYFNDFGEVDIYPESPKFYSSSLELVKNLSGNYSNIIYCNSINDTIQYARSFKKFVQLDNRNFTQAEINELKSAIKLTKELIHPDYFLIECLKCGIGFHFGRLPQIIRNKIEELFKKGIIKFLFCTSTLLEGVNLPAKNIFILKNKKGTSKMSKIDFWNLAGRAGRLNVELSGNIFCIRENKSEWKKLDVFNNKENIVLKTSIEQKIATKSKSIEEFLKTGTIDKGRQYEKEIIKYVANIICIDTWDMEDDYESPIINRLIEKDNFEIINQAKHNMEKIEIPYEVMNKSYSIYVPLQNYVFKRVRETIDRGTKVNFPDKVNYDSCLNVLGVFYDMYDWNSLGNDEKKLKKKATLPYYAQLMNSWINGSSLSSIIKRTLEFKRDNERLIFYYRNGKPVNEVFDMNNKIHVNEEINSLMYDIEHTLQFTIEKYFSNYYDMLVALLGEEKSGVNWANYLEYGSRDSIVIALQRMGFSRHTAIYINQFHKGSLKIEDSKLIAVQKDDLIHNIEPDTVAYIEIVNLLA
ncbi:DEAD/DEAH box helicase [Bacillus sp. FDAARGOS_235]|uniref:DEAD/DEAH box helicase n=1 Tax=Bacillus sp. FDAARGOS_235 TaxID=1839798 RepID=UPI0011A81ED3|nr:DEAD/DEAH box helicase [Bacillus sp. FDAARGOS_235]